MANPIPFDQYKATRTPGCLACEELLADAVDDILSAADQKFFDAHCLTCIACSAQFEEARRGAGWLALLNAPRPEPSADLVEKILAQTCGLNLSEAQSPAVPANVLEFRPKVVAPARRRFYFEPRLMMTAAMAFFSLAVTMNLAGIHLDQLHASDLKPANLQQTYYQTTAAAARRYDSLRVVHVLESRVDNLRQSPAFAQPSPESRRDVNHNEPTQPIQ